MSGIVRLAVCVCSLYSPPPSDVGSSPICGTGVSQAVEGPSFRNHRGSAVPNSPAAPCMEWTLDLIPVDRNRFRLHCLHGLVVLCFEENPRTAVGARN